jgi:hypothetical protein
MDWQHVVEKIKPYVVKIETPQWHGTGFLCMRNKTGEIIGIATAAHVVEHASEWQQPIKIISYMPNGDIKDVVLLKEDKRFGMYPLTASKAKSRMRGPWQGCVVLVVSDCYNEKGGVQGS